jgi:histidinol-phosphate/aromatic aminotransferase/cobyric acid decarboxylase-like protein
MPPLAEYPPAVSLRVHGGAREEELRGLGLDPESIIDFSTCLNPYGPCAAVMRAVRSAPIDRYPDPLARAARVALANVLDVDPDELVLGNGAADLLWTVARTLLRPGRTVAIVEPTFAEFRAAARTTGARIAELRTDAEEGFHVDPGRVGAFLERTHADLLYLCDPNNPTGTAVPAAEIARLAADHPDVVFVLDQAFLSLSETFADLAVRLPPNVLCIRSLTKEHAIAGVRVGYLLCQREVAARVEASRPAWTTSAPAQAAVLAACVERRFVEETRPRLIMDRDRLRSILRHRGLHPLPSVTPFFLVPVMNGADLRHRLLVRHRILVRDCRSFGLSGFVRLSARPPADAALLDAALAEEVSTC